MTPPLQSLWRSWLIIGTLVVICSVIAWRTGGPSRIAQALGNGGQLFLSVLPNLILGFLLAGFIHVLVPDQMISNWMGPDSGAQGLFVGTVAGMFTPGGPFMHFPILASFISKGAAVGPICAYITAWSLLGFSRFLVWELPILGHKLALARYAASLALPPFIGWLASQIHRLWRLPT